MHPLQVPCQVYQGLLAVGRVQASEVKAPEAHHILDHPEHRLHGRLAPSIHGLALSVAMRCRAQACRTGVRQVGGVVYAKRGTGRALNRLT